MTIDVDAVETATWYHTIDLPGGISTPGTYDLRPALSRLPWPELRGLRCLDVGSRDGFYAFEMERRGAAEVVSLDIDDPSDIHFPAFRPENELIQNDLDNGKRAFDLAHQSLGSTVQRRCLSVYRLEPEAIGTFDFAVLGTLLLHLRDPALALSAIRRVLNGPLLVNEAVNPSLDLFRRRPVAEALMWRGTPFWWLANPSGIARLLEAGGFDVVASGRPYMIRHGTGARRQSLARCLRRPFRDIPKNIVYTRGSPHCWFLAQPASTPPPG